jgi:hypothetical protein
MPEIRVQDEQGNVHVFPDGSTPEMIAKVMNVKVAPSAPVQQEQPGMVARFVNSMGSAMGAPERMSDVLSGPAYAVQHPIDSAKLLYNAASQSQQQLIDKAYDYQNRPGLGNKVKGLAYGVYSAIPFAGPTLAHAGEQMESGDMAGGIGTTLGAAAPIVMGEMGGQLRANVKLPAKLRAGMQGKAADLYQSALKPSNAKNAPNPANLVKTGLDNGIPVSQGGLDKLSSLIDDYNVKIADEVKNSPAMVNKYKVASRLNDTYDAFKTQVNPTSDINAIADSGNEFLGTQPAQIPAADAQALKVGTYRQLKGKAYTGELKSASIESQKALARGIKEELNQAIPELAGLNAEESRLLGLEPALEKAVNRINNHQAVGIGTPIAAGAAKAVSGSGAVGVVTGVMKAVLDNPNVKSRLATALYRAGRGKFTLPAARARVQGYVGALSAASVSSNETPDDQSTQ